MGNNILLEAIGKMMDDKLETVKTDLSQMVDDKLEPVKESISNLENGFAELKQDNVVMKASFTRLEQDNVVMKANFTRLEQDNSSIKADIAKLNHIIVPKIEAIYEGIGGIQEKFNRLDTLEDTVKNQGNRIYALEQERKAQ